MSKLAMQPSFRAVGQTREMVDIEKPENKRQMYGSQSTIDHSIVCMAVMQYIILVMPDYHTFVSYFRVFQMSTIRRVFGLQL